MEEKIFYGERAQDFTPFSGIFGSGGKLDALKAISGVSALSGLLTAEQEEAAQLRPRPLDYRNAQDRFWLESGQNLVDNNEMTQVLFDFYKKNDRLIYSPREQDKWIIDLWRKEKKRLEDEARATSRPGINLQVMQGGAVTGQTDDGISNVRIKK